MESIERLIRGMLDPNKPNRVWTLEKTVTAGETSEITEETLDTILSELRAGQEHFLANKPESVTDEDDQD